MNVDDAYIKKYKGKSWALVRNSFARRGSYVPVGGWRNFDKRDPVVPVGSTTLKGSPFDELRNFSSSEIGELASPITNSSKLEYYIYGFSKYLKVTRPCRYCENAARKNCECDLIYSTLSYEVDELEKSSKNPLDPFPITLHRDFTLRVASYYPSREPIIQDRLSLENAKSLFVPASEFSFEKDSRPTDNNRLKGWLEKVKNNVIEAGTLEETPPNQPVDIPTVNIPEKLNQAIGDIDDTTVDETMSTTVVSSSKTKTDTDDDDAKKKEESGARGQTATGEDEHFGPTNELGFCHSCNSIKKYILGKCNACLQPYTYTSSEAMATRYTPHIPHSLTTHGDQTKIQHNIDRLYSRKEVMRSVDGKYQFKPLSTDDPNNMLMKAHTIMTARLRYDTLEKTSLPPETSEATSFIL